VTTPAERDELLRNFEKLSPENQQELLAHVRSLTKTVRPLRGTPGKNLAAFSGVIEPNELTKIAQAIEDCEQVDRSAW
jgi:hypothetical protein